VLGFGLLIPGIYFLWSMRYGRFAPANPWPGTSLEWRTPSPPPTENFTVTPVVTWEAYEYRPIEEMRVIGPGAPDQPVGGQHPANRGVETEDTPSTGDRQP
jgi:cytochrome c oxidase subunit 1